MVAFIGRTRATPGTPAPGQEDEAARHAGRGVDGLEYEAFEPMAVARARGDRRRDRGAVGRVPRLAIVHRSGAVPLGEASVAIVAVAPHRDAAFAAARYAIDETKARAPIWKAERFTDGHVWVGHVARTGPPSRRRTDGALAPPAGRQPYCGHAAAGEAADLEALLAPRDRARGRLGQRRAPPRPPSARSARSCACSACRRARPRRAGRSRPRSSTATSARTRAASAAGSRSRSRWPWRSTTSRRRSSRSRSPRATWTSGSRRSCSPSPTGARSRSPTPRRWRGRRWTGWTRTGRRAASCWRCSATRLGRGSATGLGSAAIVDALDEARAAIDAGAELVRVDVPPSRELAERTARPRRPVERWRAHPSSRGGLDTFDPSGPADPDRRPARARGPAPVRRRGGRAPPRLRPDHDRRAGAGRAGPGGGGRVRADRHRHRRPDARDRRRPGRPRPGDRRPRVRAPAAGARRDAGARPGRAADRRRRPRRGRAVRSGHARRARARAPAAGGGPRAARRPGRPMRSSSARSRTG